MANKITYGLSNVMIWPITSVSEDGKPTYGTGFKQRGAVEISLSAEGSSDPSYADNSVWVETVTNSGYSGDLTIMDMSDDFKTKILNQIVDGGGALFEDASVQPSEFAMAFQFEGDESARRHVFYRCKATRPDIASSTKEDSTEPNNESISITCRPRLDNNKVKASCESGDACYSDWFGTAPYEYTEA